MAPLAPLTELHTLELSHNRLQAVANPTPNPNPNRLQAVWPTLPIILTLTSCRRWLTLPLTLTLTGCRRCG